ncbi:MAG TPA: 2,3-diphosphoglycerate synthetase [Planctomycetota bacterium]|nr:2,3-diphosphoglycerate synthetase [Planctomycetota bacterium]
MRTVVLIDGEHYLPVTKAALDDLRTREGADIIGAVFLGGMEKIGDISDLDVLGIPVVHDEDMLQAVRTALDRFRPDVVFDLSDEPVVNYRVRFALACQIVAAGVTYRGADFRFESPVYHAIPCVPSMTVLGSGKRVGKTAVAAHIARLLSGQEDHTPARRFHPCIVTMGRGGPPEPQLIRGDQVTLTPEYLLKEADAGRHAASDHYEDALTARVPTIGCRRCGGGMAGVVFHSVVPEGAKLANTLDCDLQIYEGSGASVPPIATDVWVLTVGAHQPIDEITGYLGPYRVKRSDLILLTMCEPPGADAEKVERMAAALADINPAARIVRTVFRPRPLGDVAGRSLFYVTTAPPAMGDVLVHDIETRLGAKVTGVSHSLAKRPRLRKELGDALTKNPPDAVLVEVKAAGIDVATRMAHEHGVEVIYVDNIPKAVDGQDLAGLVDDAARLAVERFEDRRRT